jgi:hypothetical protein
MRAHIRSALVAGAALVALGGAAMPATASTGEPNPAGFGQTLQPISCSGLGDLLIRTTENNSDGSWSAAHIVDGGSGTLIPTSFTFSAYDETANLLLVPPEKMLKGDGAANHQQSPVLSCVQSMEGPLADFLEPGDTAPPGTDPTDTVVVSFTVTALHVS